ncbi:MAG: ABC transporter ATP-binding protein [Candidatus Promineifilaceae bacterium]
MALVRVTDLTYRYPQTAVPALQNVTFSVEPGEFVAVIGANDAGKSTLCYALTGYVPHFFHGQMDGSVQLAGLETRERPLPELVTLAGLVFQNPTTQMSGVRDTVRGEVGFGLENLGVPRAEMHLRIAEALAMTGTTELAERHPRELSGGQQQRVALAAMLAMRPQLLVLDEPTAQLDPVGSRELFAALQRLSRTGLTLVLATHKLEWAAAYADRLLLLHEGRLVQQGTPQALLTQPQLADWGIAPLPFTEAARQAREEGLWDAERPLPITLADAIVGFLEMRDTSKHF